MNRIVVGIGKVSWDMFSGRLTIGRAAVDLAHHTAQSGLNFYTVNAIGNGILWNTVSV